MLGKAVREKYSKAGEEDIKEMIDQEKKFAANLDLEERIEIFNRGSAYITLKDHKDNYMNNPKFRLINRAKQELGMVSKKMLANIVHVKEKSQLFTSRRWY